MRACVLGPRLSTCAGDRNAGLVPNHAMRAAVEELKALVEAHRSALPTNRAVKNRPRSSVCCYFSVWDSMPRASNFLLATLLV